MGVLVLAACGREEAAEGGLRVVATTTIVGALVEEVAGEGVAVDVLLPVGADPHDYQPSASEIASLHAADLVVANGLGLEEALLEALAAAQADGVRVLELGSQIEPLPMNGTEQPDPHFWFDPLRLGTAARALAAELARVDDSGDWEARAAAFASDLEAADREIRDILSVIPTDDRHLITNHDAFTYFAARYELEIVGSVFPGSDELADPSSSHLADLVRLVTLFDTMAIFSEAGQSSEMAEAVAAETGRPIEVVALYSDSLGEPGSGADTLIGMLLTDARLIADALSR